MDRQSPGPVVVLPLLNEHDNIRPLYKQTIQILTNNYKDEIIFLDAGSSDNSKAQLT